MKKSIFKQHARLFAVGVAFVVCAGLFTGGATFMTAHPDMFSGISASAAVQGSLTAPRADNSTDSGADSGASSSTPATESTALTLPNVAVGDSLDTTTRTSLPGADISLRAFNLGHKQWLDVTSGAPVSAAAAPINRTFSLVAQGSTYQLRASDNTCLTVMGDSTSSTLRMQTCATEPRQNFLSLGQVGGGIVLQSTFTGTAVTAVFASQSLQLAPVSGVAEQRWLLLPA